MDLQAVQDELYGLEPSRFTSTRDALARSARGEGDTQLAQEIRKLRRPSIPAWLVNQLARQRRDQLEEALEVGVAMRQAQSQEDGTELRELGRRRREIVAALGAEARRIASANGHTATDATIRSIEDTIEAALIDLDASEAVRHGCLTEPLHPGATPFAGGALPRSRTQRRDKQIQERHERAEEEAADREALDAAKGVDSAQRALSEATEAAGRIEAELSQARKRVDAASAALKAATQRRAEALERLDRARGG